MRNLKTRFLLKFCPDAVRERLVVLKLTADSSLDITDPAVLESILNTVTA